MTQPRDGRGWATGPGNPPKGKQPVNLDVAVPEGVATARLLQQAAKY